MSSNSARELMMEIVYYTNRRRKKSENMRKTVEVCDSCKQNIAKYKCKICHSDMCEVHIYALEPQIIKESSRYKGIYIYTKPMSRWDIEKNSLLKDNLICYECNAKMENRFKAILDAITKLSEDKKMELEQEICKEILSDVEKIAKVLII